jgi:hypothetical protein
MATVGHGKHEDTILGLRTRCQWPESLGILSIDFREILKGFSGGIFFTDWTFADFCDQRFDFCIRRLDEGHHWCGCGERDLDGRRARMR